MHLEVDGHSCPLRVFEVWRVIPLHFPRHNDNPACSTTVSVALSTYLLNNGESVTRRRSRCMLVSFLKLKPKPDCTGKLAVSNAKHFFSAA